MVKRQKSIAVAALIAPAALFSLVGGSIAADIAEASAQGTSCESVGMGYQLVPGTDVCLRIGVRTFLEASTSFGYRELELQSGYSGTTPTVTYEAGPQEPPEFETYASGSLSAHAIRQTDLGQLETYVQLRGTYRDGSLNAATLTSAYASLAGWTAGYRSSAFDYSTGYTNRSGYTSDQNVWAVSYAAELNENTYLTASLEDGRVRQVADGVWAQYGATDIPDLVVALDHYGEQETLRGALAVHRVSDLRATEKSAGWAATAAWDRQIQMGDFTDRFLITGAYAQGALGYLGIPFYATDFIYDENGELALTQGYSAIASYRHQWSREWRSAATVSAYQTHTATDALAWTSTGALAAINLEYVAVPGLQVGAEASLDWDRLAAAGVGGQQPAADNTYVTTTLYVSGSL